MIGRESRRSTLRIARDIALGAVALRSAVLE